MIMIKTEDGTTFYLLDSGEVADAPKLEDADLSFASFAAFVEETAPWGIGCVLLVGDKTGTLTWMS